MKSPQRYQALVNARIARGKYQCTKCMNVFKQKELQVDHIIPIGKWNDYNQFIERLFCDSTNLQALCVRCHKQKTKKESK